MRKCVEKDWKIESLENKVETNLQAIDDLQNKQKVLEGEKKSLEDSLKVSSARGENESEELRDLDRVGLIAKGEQFEFFLVEGTRHGFNISWPT